MRTSLYPPPAFEPLRKVVVIEADAPRPGEGGILGEHGVIMWRTSQYLEPVLCGVSGWLYVVHYPAIDVYQAIAESRILPTDQSVAMDYCLGRDFEISYDPDGDAPESISGAIRTLGRLWEAFVVRRAPVDLPSYQIKMPVSCYGGKYAKYEFAVPEPILLDSEYIEPMMSAALGAGRWRRVLGPHSSWFA